MTNILVKSNREKEELSTLISKEIPNYRQAYSDRTSFIMACLSELVYLQFNKPFFDKDDKKLIKKVSLLIDNNKLSSFKKLYEIFGYDHEEEIKKLKEELSFLNLELVKTFDNNGTQAIIIKNDSFYVLAFRGTEVTSIKDIKADLKANIRVCESGGKMHTGFYDAFNEVYIDIQNYLNSLEKEDKPLFITGHSLGGALAIVATKKLKYSKIAACYTYGSPRVGNEEWMNGIKTPIYRIVNSADPVTMLPPGGDLITFTTWILRLLRLTKLSKNLSDKFGGYYHLGYMRFLTNVDVGDYKSAKLLYSVTLMRRLRAYYKKVRAISDLPSDHSISVYRKKLKSIAIEKNKNKEN
ncbi:lipase family protein [Arcobacter sp. YIC-310]|uniref:lipase family protein n=1 Tax=Arcobacter sp. YIC-310 TaxID=3376632 RepID=UPI003C1E195C